MRVLRKEDVLRYFGFTEKDAEALERWCQDNGYYGVFPTKDVENGPSDLVLAAALYYAQNKHHNPSRIDVCSFATLVAYLATGWYGGFGTDEYEKEQIAEKIITAFAGGIPPAPDGVVGFVPAEEPVLDAEKVLRFLEGWYFEDQETALIELLEGCDSKTIAQAILAAARTQAEYEELAEVARDFLRHKANIASLRTVVKKVFKKQ